MPSHRYNTKKYNVSHYNNDGTAYYVVFTETITVIDTVIKNLFRTLAEAVSSNDAFSDSFNRNFAESIVSVDIITKAITDKVISDSLRLQDWISIKKSPANNNWSN